MTVVVDANVAMHWTIASPHTGQAESLLRSGVPLIAPDLIVVQVTNALYVSMRGRPERAQRALDGLEFLPRWFTELVPTASLRHLAMAHCRELDHPAYDCFYLALAASRRARLVTTDAQLIRKARSAGTLAEAIVHLEDWRP